MKHTIKEFRSSLIRVSFCKLNHFIQNHFFWSSKETILNISDQKQNLIHYIHPLISKALNMTINFLFKHTFIERKSVPHPQNIFHIYFFTPPLIKKITNNICQILINRLSKSIRVNLCLDNLSPLLSFLLFLFNSIQKIRTQKSFLLSFLNKIL